MTETGGIRKEAGSCGGCGGCGNKAPPYGTPCGGGSVLVQALTALLPPFLGFVAGYMLVPSGSQALRAAAGCAGLFIAAGILFFFRKYLPPGKLPVVYYKKDTAVLNSTEVKTARDSIS